MDSVIGQLRRDVVVVAVMLGKVVPLNVFSRRLVVDFMCIGKINICLWKWFNRQLSRGCGGKCLLININWLKRIQEWQRAARKEVMIEIVMKLKWFPKEDYYRPVIVMPEDESILLIIRQWQSNDPLHVVDPGRLRCQCSGSRAPEITMSPTLIYDQHFHWQKTVLLPTHPLTSHPSIHGECKWVSIEAYSVSSDSAATSVDREWTERDTLDRVRGEGESKNKKKNVGRGLKVTTM